VLSVYEDIKYIHVEWKFTASTYRLCYIPNILAITDRLCIYTYLQYSERYVYIKTYQFKFSHRYVYISNKLDTKVSERYIFTIGSGLYNERYCIFKHDIKFSIFDLSLNIPIIRYDKRYIYVFSKYNTFRYCFVLYPRVSERYIKIVSKEEYNIYDLDIYKDLKANSNRYIYIEYAYTDYRYIYVDNGYRINTERKIYVNIYHEGNVFDLDIYKDLSDYSERYIYINPLYAYDSRYIIVNDFSSYRYIHVGNGFINKSSEIKGMYIPHIEGGIYDMDIINAIPEVSLRLCITEGFVYNTERKVYVEGRPKYIYRKYPSNYPYMYCIPLDHNLAIRKIYTYSPPEIIINYSNIQMYHIYENGKLYLIYPYKTGYYEFIIFTKRGEILTHSIDKNIIEEEIYSVKMKLKIKKQ